MGQFGNIGWASACWLAGAATINTLMAAVPHSVVRHGAADGAAAHVRLSGHSYETGGRYSGAGLDPLVHMPRHSGQPDKIIPLVPRAVRLGRAHPQVTLPGGATAWAGPGSAARL